MPNTQNSGNINVGQTLLDMNKLLGQITQLTADTSNDVKDIKQSQKTADQKLANVEFKIDEFQKDLTGLQARSAAHEERLNSLEQRDTKRTSWFKGALWVVISVGSLLFTIVMNLPNIIEVWDIWKGVKGDQVAAEISPAQDQPQN